VAVGGLYFGLLIGLDFECEVVSEDGVELREAVGEEIGLFIF
jgi:hypothetical protein